RCGILGTATSSWFPPSVRSVGLLDMGANERLTHPPRRPRFQYRPQASPNLRQIAELFVEVSRLSAHELEDMRAGSATRPPDRNYLLDLLQREAEPSGLHDKRDDRTRVISIDTVACRGTPRCLEKCLPPRTDATLCGWRRSWRRPHR